MNPDCNRHVITMSVTRMFMMMIMMMMQIMIKTILLCDNYCVKTAIPVTMIMVIMIML